jgi:hypothetical protein
MLELFTSTPITVITALITAIFGPIVVEWIKVKFITKKIDIVGESIVVNEKIDSQLEILMEELKCDRICISQFHNGGHFYPTGKSIKKFSIFYELTKTNIDSVKNTFQNIPVSLFPKVFSTLYKDGEINIPRTSENAIDCGLFHVNGKEYKTKSFYMLSISDMNDNFIGSLTISYYNEEHTLTTTEWILLSQKIGVIGAILTNYLQGVK